MKILVFGDFNQVSMPMELEVYIGKVLEVLGEEAEFIVGDNRGLDTRIHNVLSKLGAGERTVVYGVNKINSNEYGFETNVIEVAPEYDENGAEVAVDYTGVKMQYLVDDCDAAICVWDGENKTTFNRITKLKVRDKEVRIVRV